VPAGAFDRMGPVAVEQELLPIHLVPLDGIASGEDNARSWRFGDLFGVVTSSLPAHAQVP